MSVKDYMSSSHANWENIQIDSFTSWINQHLSERGLSVKDLSVDFQDGVLLINLLEILSGKKIPRYVRSPKFLQHKIDNIMIAFGFMEKIFDIKVFGCNAKDIVDGNLKQTMGVIFLLIQKIKVNLHLDHLQQESGSTSPTPDGASSNAPSTTGAAKSGSKLFYRASLATNAVNRFSHITPNRENKENISTTSTTPAPSSTTTSTPSSTVSTTPSSTIPVTNENNVPTVSTNVPTNNNIAPASNGIRILPTTGVSVSTIRSKFLIDEKHNTFSPSSSSSQTEKVLKRTESGHVISGGLSLSGSFDRHDPLTRSVSLIEIKLNDHQTKFYDLKKIIFMQAHIRGFLIRLRWKELLRRYRTKLTQFKQHFEGNSKAHKGLLKAQASIRGKIQRKKLFKMFPLYRRNEIVKEIISTEDKYVHSLATVTTQYLKPSEAFLTTQQVRSIFSQIEIIYRYNSLILEKLQNRNKIWYSSGQKIGDIFIEMSEFLKVYTIYVNNYNNSIQTITECMENQKFAALLDKNRNQLNLDLSAFLIMPIQRLPRYILLLQDLLKNTKETHTDYNDLSIALKKMKDVAEYVNEKKREAENLNQVLNIQSSLTGKFNNLAEPHRRYVKKGTLISNDKIYLYFLFNDLLVKTENKAVTKIRDSARLSSSSGGNSKGTFTFNPKEIVSEGKSKYLNSFFLAGSSLVDNNPDGFTFQIIGVGDANELNNNDSSPTLSFSPFSTSVSNISSTPMSPSPLLSAGSIPTTSISLEALSLNEKMTWMGELDECIYQLLEKTRSKKRSLITDVEELTTLPYDTNVVKDNEFSNVLEKKHSEISWRAKKFYLKNTHLYYHRIPSSEKEPTKIKCINLILCSVKLAQVVDHPHCFQLITPSRIYFFSCSDSTNLFQWISSIRLSIKKKLESLKEEDTISASLSVSFGGSGSAFNPLSSHPPQKNLELQHSLSSSLNSTPTVSSPTISSPSSATTIASQESILNIAGNNLCAECGACDPSWVSINYGVVVCLDCSSIHKNLPDNNVKSVRSLSVAFSDIVKKQEGNTKANSRYERNIPTNIVKPNPKDNYETKLTWIKAKYLTQTPSSDNLASIQITSDSPSLNPSSPQKDENVKLESISGRNTPSIEINNDNSNNNNIDNTSNNNDRPITPTPVASNINNERPTTPKEEVIEGLNLKSGTDTSNGKGTWRSGNHHSERKASFLDKPSRVPPQKREHEGYLYKTSRPTSKDAGDWKKYLFIFKDDVITYYKVSKKNKKKEKGIIDLFHSVKQEFDRPKQKYSFTLITSQRLYFLAAETEEEMKSWLDVLNSAIKP
ncbi:hypothetical protein DICPUDRAFT_46997 [Dictyostelium purpureum]|uniref:Pleckstrin domain-containing protein n=1 Tax=Dictyostelium purpureum TaxID=5786 RepID=F0ZH73_DICPU|nr:uncharacterized protein DICPUDRAFT_46997 [Dictyostelium purpureum]EGC36722.1 hypothetical protein DICPUDRAFT_46997 [Dictyostelium purpureum]|eukprot:XP_003286747.1 hypothetical protein DICPUDRAFT_46997 [Dictyostelium purpureum]